MYSDYKRLYHFRLILLSGYHLVVYQHLYVEEHGYNKAVAVVCSIFIHLKSLYELYIEHKYIQVKLVSLIWGKTGTLMLCHTRGVFIFSDLIMASST